MLGETLVVVGTVTVITRVTIFTEEARAIFVLRIGIVVVVVGKVVLVLVVVGPERDAGCSAAERCSGVELDDAVKVNTRIKRRMGLDHITQ
ncbi:MAG TPA: hypothetical protein VG246_11685 [Acidimicrobiales bacterium]|nr:hypothetical protein [Acidimicrobiales bacterium]